jgi:hypothetical protein
MVVAGEGDGGGAARQSARGSAKGGRRGTRSSTITGVGGRVQSTHLTRSARILRQMREEENLLRMTHFSPHHEWPIQLGVADELV